MHHQPGPVKHRTRSMPDTKTVNPKPPERKGGWRAIGEILASLAKKDEAE